VVDKEIRDDPPKSVKSMDDEVLVKAEGLSKKFCKDLKTSLWYGIQDLIDNFRGNKEERYLRDKEFWAVKDISFELRRGECLGLIGHNGAGKSTLLKILNGLIKPDAGKVTIKGRVGALIELGAGFNPILTGRENIFNNGAILGFTRKEINAKLEEIIDFAEIREFIDMPVQNYSSGMKVRLGFAVAAQMEPDVLIIDEVLAVGDVGFRGKCMATITKLLERSAVIFVSHSMPQVNRYCTHSILLNNGELEYKGNTEEAISLYYKYFGLEKGNKFIATNCKFNYLKLNGSILQYNTISEIEFNSYIDFEISCLIPPSVKTPEIKLLILNQDLMVISTAQSKPNEIINYGSDLIVNLKTGPIILRPGPYKISLNVSTEGMKRQLIYFESWWSIEIKGENDFGSNFIVFNSKWEQLQKNGGMLKGRSQ